MKKIHYVLVLAGAGVVLLASCGLLGTSPPDTPTGLAVSGSTSSSLSISWSASARATSYRLFRSSSASGTFTDKVFEGSNTSFVDTGLTASTTYFYEVQAVNSAGMSALSTAVSGTSGPPQVYIGGSIGSSSTALVPVYWTKGAMAQLTMGQGNGFGYVTSATVDGSGNIYFGGCAGVDSTSPVPVFWDNGAATTLSTAGSGTTGIVNGIGIDASGQVHSVGSVGTSTSTQVPGYWVNGVGAVYLLTLSGSNTIGAAWGPAIQANAIGTVIYFAGFQSDGTTNTPYLWSDGGAVQTLPVAAGDTASADIVMEDSLANIYVGGSETAAGSAQIPVYWANGTRYQLSMGTNTQGAVTSGAVDGSGNVYFAGYVGTSVASQTAAYWNGGQLVTLPINSGSVTGNTMGQANGIAVDAAGVVYLVGWVGTSTSNEKPAYWKNGTLEVLSTGSVNYGSASSVALRN